MARLTSQPGGNTCSDPAFGRVREIFDVAFRRTGADPVIGRRVPELFRQAGLADVGVESRTQMYPTGNSRRTVRLDLVRAMRPQIVEMGPASKEELDELDATLRPHLEDSRTVVMTGLLFLSGAASPHERCQLPRSGAGAADDDSPVQSGFWP